MLNDIWLLLSFLFAVFVVVVMLVRTLKAVQRKERQRELCDKYFFADQQGFQFFEGSSPIREYHLQDFKLFNTAKTFDFSDVFVKTIRNYSLVLGNFSFWKISGDGTQEKFEQTVFAALTKEIANVELGCYSTSGWFHRMFKQARSIKEIESEMARDLLDKHEWNCEVSKVGIIVYAIDRVMPSEKYDIAISDLLRISDDFLDKEKVFAPRSLAKGEDEMN